MRFAFPIVITVLFAATFAGPILADSSTPSESPSPSGPSSASGTPAATPGKKLTKAELAAQAREKHVTQGMADAESEYEQGDIDAAIGTWYGVLKLDGSNEEARKRATEASVRQAKNAFENFVDIRTTEDMALVLDTATCDRNARELVWSLRFGIQSIEGSNRYTDNTVYDDFENFVEVNGLANVSTYYEGSSGRLGGRSLMHELARWVDRVHHDGLAFKIVRPVGLPELNTDVSTWQFSVVSPGVVFIDGPASIDYTPLEAVYQDGAWRIGPRKGYSISYRFQAYYSNRHNSDGY